MAQRLFVSLSIPDPRVTRIVSAQNKIQRREVPTVFFSFLPLLLTFDTLASTSARNSFNFRDERKLPNRCRS